jgi:hypothetical protein
MRITIEEIEAMECNVLPIKVVSDFLECDPQLIRDEATKNPKFLGFPIAKVGHAFKIPKAGFLCWVNGKIPVIQVVSSNELFRSFEKIGM